MTLVCTTSSPWRIRAVSAARRRSYARGRPTKVVKFATDITAQKQAEAESRAQDLRRAADTARIRQGLDVVQTNVMVADADLNVVYVNDSIRKMLTAAEADIRKDVLMSFHSTT